MGYVNLDELNNLPIKAATNAIGNANITGCVLGMFLPDKMNQVILKQNKQNKKSRPHHTVLPLLLASLPVQKNAQLLKSSSLLMYDRLKSCHWLLFSSPSNSSFVFNFKALHNSVLPIYLLLNFKHRASD